MRQQFNNLYNYLKSEDFKGCITGSYFVGEFEDQDIDLFIYKPSEFLYAVFKIKHNPDFQLYEELDYWKFNRLREKGANPLKNNVVHTIKFLYNNCVILNVSLKNNCTNIFDVLSTFDFDIVARGYDLVTKQFIDLSENDGKNVYLLKHNPVFINPNELSNHRLYRVLQRIYKYHQRGFNMEQPTNKFIEFCDIFINNPPIFTSYDQLVKDFFQKQLILLNKLLLLYFKEKKTLDGVDENIINLLDLYRVISEDITLFKDLYKVIKEVGEILNYNFTEKEKEYLNGEGYFRSIE